MGIAIYKISRGQNEASAQNTEFYFKSDFDGFFFFRIPMKVPVCVCQTDLIYVGYYYHITFLVTRLTRRVPLMEHELLPFRST
jgi:hypothetical protein